jgi:hypothetical protein
MGKSLKENLLNDGALASFSHIIAFILRCASFNETSTSADEFSVIDTVDKLS